MASSLQSIGSVGRPSQIDPVEAVLVKLDENLLLDEDFSNELKKHCPYYEHSTDLIDSINIVRRNRIRSDEEILEDLSVAADSLDLHTDLGNTKVADMCKQYKETIQNSLEELQFLEEYEKRHLMGRQGDIKQIVKDMTEKSYVGVCITGMAGNGKTTLAEHIGLQFRHSGKCFDKIDAREVDSLSHLIRDILGKYGIIASPNNETIDSLTASLCCCLENENNKEKERILLLDNVEDIQEWDELLRFLETVMSSLTNIRDNKIKILITSRKKLVSNKDIMRNFRSLFHTETSQDRFNHMCSEKELKPLTPVISLELIDNLLPENKISKLLKSMMAATCGQNPLVIHTLCKTVQNNIAIIPDMLGNTWSLKTLFTGQNNLNGCIRESFKHIEIEHQRVLVSLHVFKTGHFNIEDAKHITENAETFATKLKLIYLKNYHLVELKNKNGKCYFSIHPLISNFLEEVKDEMQDVFSNAVKLFIKLMQKKIDRYESKLETDFFAASEFLLDYQVHFNHYFRLLLKYPSNGPRTVKLNKQISAVADLTLSNEKKCLLMMKLKDECKKESNKLMTCFWMIEEAEEYLDEDKTVVAEEIVRKVENMLWKFPSYHKKKDMMTVLIFLLHLKARIYFRKDSFQDAYKSIEITINILSDNDFARDFTTLHANIYNILGYVLLREKRSENALHCFLEAFNIMTRKNNKHRSQKMVLFISNMGSCHYQRGMELKENKSHESKQRAHEEFRTAMKFYQKAISLRERMNQIKYATFACELVKRGKVYLEMCDTRNAMIDFVEAFKIHCGIESYPHVQITLSLYLTAKAILLEGKEYLKRECNDIATEAFKYASPIFVCVAECIKHGGLFGYKEEFEEIKANHIWLLRQQKRSELKQFEDLYKGCTLSGNTSMWMKLFGMDKNLKSSHESVLKELKNRSTDELLEVFDEKMKQKIRSIGSHERHDIEEHVERTVDNLPYIMNSTQNDMQTEIPDEEFFQDILSLRKNEDHEHLIRIIKLELHENCKKSTDTSPLNLISHFEEKCQKGDRTQERTAEKRKI